MTRNLEIRVRGTLPAGAAERLGLVASVEPGDTVLRGHLRDRPALHGVLDRLCANGIEVVEVRRLPEPTSGRARASPPRGDPASPFPRG
jgi:hypothetical protein